VTADNRAGSAALVAHLIDDHGLRRLYHVDGPPTAPDARERRLALHELLGAHPACQLAGRFEGVVRVGSGVGGRKKLLTARAGARTHTTPHGAPLPTAGVAGKTDQLPRGPPRPCARAGGRARERVPPVVSDNFSPGSLYPPPLPPPPHPRRLRGERACPRLLD